MPDRTMTDTLDALGEGILEELDEVVRAGHGSSKNTDAHRPGNSSATFRQTVFNASYSATLPRSYMFQSVLMVLPLLLKRG